MLSRGRIVVILITLVGSAAATASAQSRASVLLEAKALYDDAAYEDALKVLDKVAGADAAPEVHQYRALCLIALGRADAAESAIALVMAADPFFVPDSEEVAPRVVALFAETRRKLLPQIVRRAFTEARALFRDGARERAIARFADVLILLADPSLAGDQDLQDLKLVAGGFVDLQQAQPAPAPPVPPVPALAAPAPVASTTPDRAPAVAETRGSVVTRPTAINQVLPQWRPPDTFTASRSYAGAVRVMIDTEGKVTAAVMERPVHPSYDRVVLEAARSWVYKPATYNGKAIGSETIVEIRLEPRN